jgi:putative nucleotidyltransferase with HDIG domain
MNSAPALLKRFKNTKTLPHVAIRLTRLMADENTSIQAFEDIIKMDPTLVLRLLRLVNSPYYGVQQKIESIARAIVFIGMKNLRNMVVTAALRDIFKEGADTDIFSRRKLWLHCAAMGVCCQMIAERVFGMNGENAFLCGILHDIGLIVQDQVVHKELIQVCRAYEPGVKPITAYEEEIIGTDHSAIGHLLARDWKLPEDVQDGIKKHHRLLTGITPDSVAGIVQIAELLVTRLNFPAIQGMEPGISPPLAEHIRENMGEYRALTRDLPEEMTKARDLYEVDDES